MQTIKSHPKLKNYSVKQILLEVKKLKVNTIDDNNIFVNEITKLQKIIFLAFNINPDDVASLNGY